MHSPRVPANTPRPPVWAAPTPGAEPGLSLPSLSVIVPTRNEAGNVIPLLERIACAAPGLAREIIFVDDSTDHTPEVIRSCRGHFPFDVMVIARPPERRNGLGRAVVEGLGIAQSEWVCVMDGDLQHPPEVIPQLLDHARSTGSTLVAASRFTLGSASEGLSGGRKVISHALMLISRLLFPHRLARVSDPLTGFFLVRRDLVDVDRLRPEGFKILLEILVRSPDLQVSELPFAFAERHAGASKANAHQSLLLLRQLLRLQLLGHRHFVRFVTVGVSGLVVNTLLLAFLVERAGFHYLLGAVVATQGSTGWNFLWTERWVFDDRAVGGRGRSLRLASFFALSNGTLLVRGPLLAAAVDLLHMHYLWANVLSLFVLMLVRFAVSSRLIWPGRRRTTGERAAHILTGNP